MTRRIEDFDFPLDHFGLVASPLMQQLTDQSSNRRSRRSALFNLGRIAKASKQIKQDAEITSIGLVSNRGGEIFLRFETVRELKVHEQTDA